MFFFFFENSDNTVDKGEPNILIVVKNGFNLKVIIILNLLIKFLKIANMFIGLKLCINPRKSGQWWEEPSANIC